MPASMWNIRWQCHAQRPSVGCHQEADALCRLHRQGVAARKEATVGAFQLAPHAVQVHGMGHHGVVVQNDPQPLAVFEVHRRGLSELQPVQGPCVAFHVAREVQFDLPAGASLVQRPRRGMQIREGQHAPTVVAQSDAGVIEVGARHVNAHVRAGTILGASVASSSAGHGQSPPPRRVLAVIHRHATVVHGAVIHACHRPMIHPGHRTRAHPGHPGHARHARHPGHLHGLAGPAMVHAPSCRPSCRSWSAIRPDRGQARSLKTFTHGQRGTRVACPVHRLGEDRVRHPVAGRSRRRFRQDRIGTHRRSPAPRQHHRRTTVSFSPGMRTS